MTLCRLLQLQLGMQTHSSRAADDFTADAQVNSLIMRHDHKKPVLTLLQAYGHSVTRCTQAMAAPAVEADVQQTTKQVNRR